MLQIDPFGHDFLARDQKDRNKGSLEDILQKS